MTRSLSVALTLALTLACFQATALDKAGCASSAYTEVHTLSELPAEARAALQTDRFGLNGLADKNGDFNSTDLGGGPKRRFALAGLSSNSILVAVEHGGRGYFVELWMFERSGNGWRGEQQQSMGAIPRSAEELIANICK